MTSPSKPSIRAYQKMHKFVDKGSTGLLRSALILSMTSFLALSIVVPSEAAFTSNSRATITAKSDTIKAPGSLTLKSLAGGQTQLTWTASTSTITTGYKILRSTNMYGPWTEIGSVQGRTTTTFTDTSSGTTQWIYRVEAVWNKWVSTSTGFEAPPAVGKSFFDSFNSLGSLDGKVTGDGSSVWQVWSGQVPINGGGAAGTPGSGPSPNNGDVAVVRTPSNDGWVFASDFDGYERVILRGKDPSNYIYAGGAEIPNATNTGLLPEYFEIVEVRNGVKHVLGSTKPGTNKDFRVEIRGNTIKAYIDAVNGDPTSGTLHLSATSTFQQTDPLATYFGIGFNRGGFAINDFTFEAYD